MKIYHFSGDRSGSERFFKESLVEYIEAAGLSDQAAALSEWAEVKKGPNGKPYFKGSALERIFFSRSHTKGHEIVCFSGSEIGVDCENTEARPGIGERYMNIAGRCFADDELEYICGSDGEAGSDPLVRFFEVWTAKEAYMKYTGKGFAEGFSSFSALSAPGVVIETGRLSDAPHVVYSVCVARTDM